jgi:hypothetical protein
LPSCSGLQLAQKYVCENLGETCLIKEIIPNSPQGDRQFLRFASLLKMQHFEKLLNTYLV